MNETGKRIRKKDAEDTGIVWKSELVTIRAGRANPNVLNRTDGRLLWNTYTNSAGW